MIRGFNADETQAPFTLCEDAPVYSKSLASAFRVDLAVINNGTAAASPVAVPGSPTTTTTTTTSTTSSTVPSGLGKNNYNVTSSN